MYRVVTVAREYGSGGGVVADKLARRLGWELIDNALIMGVAAAANVDADVCRECDERVDSWFHRINKQAFGRGVFERVGAGEVFDGDAMVQLSRKIIQDAADRGNAVIVGRAAQCILQGRRDAFHLFVYAPMDERIRRVREAYGSAFATPARIEEQDRIRSHYVHHYYRAQWRDPHLYHALFCSLIGEDEIVNMILRALGVPQESPLHAD